MNKWPWPIPVLASNIAIKPELEGHFATEAPDFNLAVPDQIRVDIFLRHLNLAWKGSSSLVSAERGDLENDFIEITEKEANQLMGQLRARWKGAGNG